MEPLDREIIALLVADGRMSYTDLGKATGLSTSAAQQRVRRLENRGIIAGYRAVISPTAMGLNTTALIAVRSAATDPTADLVARVRRIPEIITCYSVAGHFSHILLARVETPAALEQLLTRVREALGVSTTTTVVLSTPFEDRFITRDI